MVALLPYAARLLVARHLPLEAQQRRLVHGGRAWCAAAVWMVCSSGEEHRCGMERGAAHGGLRRYSPAQWGGGVAPRQLAWGVTRRRSQCCHCLVHEKACSCAVRHGSRTPWHLMHEAVAALTCSYAMACSYAQPYAMASHARGSGSTVMLVCPAVRHGISCTRQWQHCHARTPSRAPCMEHDRARGIQCAQ